MRKAQFLQAIILLFLVASGAVAQDNTRSNGVIIEQTPCVPNPIGTYEQYVEAAKQRYTEEITEVRQEGFRMEAPTDLATRLLNKEEFERQKAYAGDRGRADRARGHS